MLCPKCAGENSPRTALRALRRSLSVALLEVVRGDAAREDPLPEAALVHGRARAPQRPRAQRAVDLQGPRPHRVRGRPLLHRGRGQPARRLRRRAPSASAARARPGRAGPARQRDAEVLAARQRELHRADGRAPVGRAAAAAAPAGADPQLHARPEPGARAGPRRDHADHRAPSAASCCSPTPAPEAPRDRGGRCGCASRADRTETLPPTGPWHLAPDRAARPRNR